MLSSFVWGEAAGDSASGMLFAGGTGDTSPRPGAEDRIPAAGARVTLRTDGGSVARDGGDVTFCTDGGNVAREEERVNGVACGRDSTGDGGSESAAAKVTGRARSGTGETFVRMKEAALEERDGSLTACLSVTIVSSACKVGDSTTIAPDGSAGEVLVCATMWFTAEAMRK